MKPLTLVYFSLLFLAMFFSSGFMSRGKTAQPTWNNLLARIQPGDIVFRLGHGFISESMRKFSLKDPKYSHAGIVSMENGKPMVYHLLGGESSATVLQKESLEKFCSPNEAASFAVYRAPLNPSQVKSVDSLNQFYFNAKLKYDSQFDLATDSAMYCTEYVYKVLVRAIGKNNIVISSSMLSGHTYIACDDIYLTATIKKIFSFDYE
jgi:Permuted papain-like amidase enzyme, YaeF/YiiX, C92 family